MKTQVPGAPCSAPMICSLEKKPASGGNAGEGRPADDEADGGQRIIFAAPARPIATMSFVPTWWMYAPAQRKSSALKKAWVVEVEEPGEEAARGEADEHEAELADRREGQDPLHVLRPPWPWWRTSSGGEGRDASA